MHLTPKNVVCCKFHLIRLADWKDIDRYETLGSIAEALKVVT